jgi:hypothetical protein
MPITRRNFLATSARTAAALTAGSFVVVEAAQSQATSAARTSVEQSLDSFIETYMKAMNSPGLTLGGQSRWHRPRCELRIQQFRSQAAGRTKHAVSHRLNHQIVRRARVLAVA